MITQESVIFARKIFFFDSPSLRRLSTLAAPSMRVRSTPIRSFRKIIRKEKSAFSKEIKIKINSGSTPAYRRPDTIAKAAGIMKYHSPTLRRNADVPINALFSKIRPSSFAPRKTRAVFLKQDTREGFDFVSLFVADSLIQ
ncbi:MAG: hypothetical protein ABI747_03890 [Candidatus Moraniibacteriota bacterium]